MADEITNGMLLEHMRAMKHDLQTQIQGVQTHITTLEYKMEKGFAAVHLELAATKEDLDATIRMVGRHQKKLAKM